MATTKRDFSALSNLITQGADAAAARPLTVVRGPAEAHAAPPAPTVEEALPEPTPYAASLPAPPLPEAPRPLVPPVELAPPPPRAQVVTETPAPEQAAPAQPMRKLTLQLTEATVLALYGHQNQLRSRPGTKPADTTIGWVADALLRKALDLPPA